MRNVSECLAWFLKDGLNKGRTNVKGRNVRFVPEADVDKTALNQLVIMTSTPLIG